MNGSLAMVYVLCNQHNAFALEEKTTPWGHANNKEGLVTI